MPTLNDYLYIRAWYELFFPEAGRETFILATQSAAVTDNASLDSIYKSVPGGRWNTIKDLDPSDRDSIARVRAIEKRVQETMKSRNSVELIPLPESESCLVEIAERRNLVEQKSGSVKSGETSSSSNATSLRQAKPTEEETQNLIDFLEELESQLFNQNSFGLPLADWLLQNYPKISGLWRRVIYAGKVAIDNACDPELDHLDWKPAIKAAMEIEEGLKIEPPLRAALVSDRD